MKEVALNIVRDDGQEFAIDNRRWLIPNDGLENWANLPHSVSVQENASYDGGTVTNRRITTVDRSVHAVLRSPGENERARLDAVKFFNPKHAFSAYLTYQGRTLWCEGVQAGFVCETGNVYRPVEFDWTLMCPMPFLLSVDDFGKDVARIRGKFGFPVHSVIASTPARVYKNGFIAGAYDFAGSVDIDNDGDLPTFPRVEVKANGAVVNPKISIGDKFVRYVGSMTDGDSLLINFTQRPPRVEFNGANAINNVDRASTFTGFAIEVGDNEFTYTADEGENVMSVVLRYHKRYLGI